MKRSHSRRARPNRAELVLEDIMRLSQFSFSAAQEGDFDLSSRVNELIIRISQMTRVRLPPEIKRTYCKRCKVSLIPGVTLSVRVRSQGRQKYVVRRCLVCGYIHRMPLGRQGGGKEPAA